MGIAQATIVTFDEEEDVVVDSGRIEVVPAWRFLYVFWYMAL